jgi:hypothetical protein
MIKQIVLNPSISIHGKKDDDADGTRRITLVEERRRRPPPPPKTKRIITHTARWQSMTYRAEEMLPEWLTTTSDEVDNDDAKLVHKQIQAKRAGYRYQDQIKTLFKADDFVTFADVLGLLVNQPKCYYCKDTVLVLYEHVREPRQWTLERLDNQLGHNRGNVVLACLQCNLRRRTMLSERYVRTQEMKRVVKMGGAAADEDDKNK